MKLELCVPKPGSDVSSLSRSTPDRSFLSVNSRPVMVKEIDKVNSQAVFSLEKRINTVCQGVVLGVVENSCHICCAFNRFSVLPWITVSVKNGNFSG